MGRGNTALVRVTDSLHNFYCEKKNQSCTLECFRASRKCRFTGEVNIPWWRHIGVKSCKLIKRKQKKWKEQHKKKTHRNTVVSILKSSKLGKCIYVTEILQQQWFLRLRTAEGEKCVLNNLYLSLSKLRQPNLWSVKFLFECKQLSPFHDVYLSLFLCVCSLLDMWIKKRLCFCSG